MENVTKLSEIQGKPVLRASTCFEELDCIYGLSEFPDRTEWGLPQGKISLWAGMSGTGKSRLCIDVVKRYSQFYYDARILYFLTEAPLEDFGTWAKDTSAYNNVYCSSEDRIDKIIETIYQVRPHLVFIDSVNEIEEFENGSKKEARRLIKGADGKPGLKQAMDDVGGHLVLLGQINQDGKTIKGGTSLPHMVDVALDIVPEKTGTGDNFVVKVGVKNRHGKKDGITIFTHTDDGVINTCENRLINNKWRLSHGLGEYVAPNYEGCTPGRWAIEGENMDARVAACKDYIATPINQIPPISTGEKVKDKIDSLNKSIGRFLGKND